MGGVKQRFGRDATAVETNTAQARIALDKNDLFTKVGGVKGCGIATGTGAQNDEFGFQWVHTNLLLFVIGYLEFWLFMRGGGRGRRGGGDHNCTSDSGKFSKP